MNAKSRILKIRNCIAALALALTVSTWACYVDPEVAGGLECALEGHESPECEKYRPPKATLPTGTVAPARP